MKGNVLIIDDNPIDIKVATKVIEGEGYACFGFSDFEEIKKWLSENTVKMIFLDLQMPKMTGFQMIPELRAIESVKLIPIVIVSGKNETEDVKKAIKLGASDYVIKPIDLMVLKEKIKSIEGKHTSEFASIAWPADRPSQSYFGFPFEILSLSEFGFKARSSFKVAPGETMELSGLVKAIMGEDGVFVRCLSQVTDTKPGLFQMQFTFVGLSEAQRQEVRKYCRQLFILSKQNQ